MAVIQPQDSLASLLGRAPRFGPGPFAGIPERNAVLFNQMAGAAMEAGAGVEAARLSAKAGVDIAKIANRRSLGQRIAGAASLLGTLGGQNRFAGDAMNQLLAQGPPSLGDAFSLVNGSLDGLNVTRGLIEPWGSPSRTTAASILRGGALS